MNGVSLIHINTNATKNGLGQSKYLIQKNLGEFMADARIAASDHCKVSHEARENGCMAGPYQPSALLTSFPLKCSMKRRKLQVYEKCCLMLQCSSMPGGAGSFAFRLTRPIKPTNKEPTNE